MKRTLMIGIALSFVCSFLNFVPVGADEIDLDAVRPEILTLRFSDSGVVFNFDNFDFQYKTIQVAASSNYEYGFTVFVESADSNDNSLRHINPLFSENVPSITEDVTAEAFPLRGWGYSLDASDRVFHSIPTYNARVFHSDDPGVEIFDFTIGAKSDENLPYGRYTNGLIFTILAGIGVDM